MKIMVVSDIHGSAFYCEQMLEAYKREEPDKMLLLGDILYHGPRNDLPKEYNPKKVIKILNDIKSQLMCVRGNCDTEVDQMVLEFPILADYCILYSGARMILATHGHNHNASSMSMLNSGDILLHGHTHIPAFEEVNGYIYVNPGSISIPKENSRHSYMIIEDESGELKFTWKSLESEILRVEKM